MEPEQKKGEWLSDVCYECLKDTEMPDCPLSEEEYLFCEKRIKGQVVGESLCK